VSVIIWIESQPVWAIACAVFGFCYALAVVVFVAAIAVERRSFVGGLKATTPTMLTPLSVIAGLLIVFLAARVWSSLDRASALIVQEASAIRASTLLAEVLPGETRTAVQGGLQSYLRFVETEDFPAMAAGHASLKRPPGLVEAMRTLLAFVPANAGQQVTQERAVGAIAQLLEVRRSRVLLSRTAISSVQWFVVLLLDGLIQLVIAMVHIDRRLTVAINLAIFSTAVAACIVLLMVNDRPFAVGGFTLQPEALLEIGRE
jgi:hypothetical protein